MRLLFVAHRDVQHFGSLGRIAHAVAATTRHEQLNPATLLRYAFGTPSELLYGRAAALWQMCGGNSRPLLIDGFV